LARGITSAASAKSTRSGDQETHDPRSENHSFQDVARHSYENSVLPDPLRH
mgnify:CR=1